MARKLPKDLEERYAREATAAVAAEYDSLSAEFDRLEDWAEAQVDKLPQATGAQGGKGKGRSKQHQRTVIEGLMTPLIQRGLSSDAIAKEVRKQLQVADDFRLRELEESTLKRHYLGPLRKKLKAKEAPGPG